MIRKNFEFLQISLKVFTNIEKIFLNSNNKIDNILK